MSALPSPVTSATETANGSFPAARFSAALNVPPLLPSSTLTLPEIELAVMMSGIPSLFTSANVTEVGPLPTEYRFGAASVPSPLFSITSTVL